MKSIFDKENLLSLIVIVLRYSDKHINHKKVLEINQIGSPGGFFQQGIMDGVGSAGIYDIMCGVLLYHCVVSLILLLLESSK